MLVLGRLSLTLALVFSLASVLFLALGARWDRKDLIRNGYYAVYAFFLTSVVASAVLLQAFLKKDFSFGYVDENSDASLSTFYRIAGFWAGQQGSFLLWLLLIAVVAVVIALLDLSKVQRLVAGAVMVLCVIGAVFAALMVLNTASNPFEKAAAGTQPFGLNPLLLHPAMVLHPPALFIGYVGLSVPFAFAVSALLLGDADKTLGQALAEVGRRSAGCSSRSASVSAPGGPTSCSASAATGAGTPSRTRPWCPGSPPRPCCTRSPCIARAASSSTGPLGLAAATFFFTILATWTTRTGLIQSVHAFEKNPLLVWILSTLPRRDRRGERGPDGLALAPLREPRRGRVAALARLHVLRHQPAAHPVRRGRGLRHRGRAADDEPDRRPEHLQRHRAAARRASRWLLIAICPLLAWRRTEGAVLARLLILPARVAALSALLWLALGFGSSLWGFIGLVVCGFAVGAVIQFVLRSARRAAGPDASLWSGLGRAFSGSRSRTAAYFVHFGMVLVVAGLIGSNVYKVEQSAIVKVKPGETASVERLHAHVQGHADRHRTAELDGRDRDASTCPGAAARSAPWSRTPTCIR